MRKWLGRSPGAQSSAGPRNGGAPLPVLWRRGSPEGKAGGSACPVPAVVQSGTEGQLDENAEDRTSHMSVIIANLSPCCFVGSQSTFLKNWLGDVSSKDGS